MLLRVAAIHECRRRRALHHHDRADDSLIAGRPRETCLLAPRIMVFVLVLVNAVSSAIDR